MPETQLTHPLVPTDWDGYLATFQTSLAWFMQHSTPAAETAFNDGQRSHFMQGGGGLPPTVPPLIDGARLVQRAFEVADFAAIEFYLRSHRRLPKEMPPITELHARLAESPLESDRAAAEMISILLHVGCGPKGQSQRALNPRDMSTDGVGVVLREINAMRFMTIVDQVNHVQFMIDPQKTPQLCKLSWPQDIASMTPKHEQRIGNEIATIFHRIQSEMLAYR